MKINNYNANFCVPENPHERECRFVLGHIEKNDSKKPLVVVGCNPSKASKEKSDTTAYLVSSIYRQLGYNSWIMINVSPFVSTKSCNLRQAEKKFIDDGLYDLIVDENFEHIEKIINEYKIKEVFGAWGDIVVKIQQETRKLFKGMLVTHDLRVFSFDEPSKEGQPLHPLAARRVRGFKDKDYKIGNKRYLDISSLLLAN